MTTYDDVLSAVQGLPVAEKARLLEAISAALRRDLSPSEPQPKRSLFGLWEGESVSGKDIADARREMWQDFPREDI